MRQSFAPRGGFALVKSPSVREQSRRRRLLAICGVVALAVASGVIGSLTASGRPSTGQAHTGPFSYFPSQ
jgi:hypothetical protein